MAMMYRVLRQAQHEGGLAQHEGLSMREVGSASGCWKAVPNIITRFKSLDSMLSHLEYISIYYSKLIPKYFSAGKAKPLAGISAGHRGSGAHRSA
jgi:hypothetical protein